ncbi:hypothetical protein [Celeribacter halophilus]|uniref:hypothetical protein n=1 Tax=Celeribacter halophilus TaxID=576117 RepID=UPI003A8EB4EE
MSDKDKPKYFNFEERQRQKARARQRDLDRVERGEISAMDLQRESMHFRNLRRDKVAIFRCKKTGEFVMASFERETGSKDEDKS